MEKYRQIIYSRYLSVGYREMNQMSLDRSYRSFDMNYTPLLPNSVDGEILEIGCGMGHFQDFLRRKGYRRCAAVDIGAERIDFCKENYPGTFILVEDTAGYLEVHRNSFDLVVMNDVVEHLTKNEAVDILFSVLSALCPSGRLIVRTPNMGAFFSSAIRYGDFTHEVGLTERSARQLLLAVGSDEVICHPGRNSIH